MSELETAMVMMMDVFDKYASAEGSKETLTKGEMKTLLEKELPGMLMSAKEQDSTDQLLKNLDENGDSELDFDEFIVFVAALTRLAHKSSTNMPPQ
ncbi:protein S100-P [Ascaphus truei]|uniref:protein S100-P n=1 Tax=Ascaphus truei TaxID=8439 RepID=UPI003F59D33E